MHFLDYGKKPEKPWRTHTGTERVSVGGDALLLLILPSAAPFLGSPQQIMCLRPCPH